MIRKLRIFQLKDKDYKENELPTKMINIFNSMSIQTHYTLVFDALLFL